MSRGPGYGISSVRVDGNDVQIRVDRALFAFISSHKLDINIFASDEWDNLLEAINQGPISVVCSDPCEAEPANLLARAAIHQIQAAQCEANARACE